MELGPHDLTPAELAEQLELDRTGHTYLAYRDQHAKLRLITLEGRSSLTLGRVPACDVEIGWDALVSRAHATLERTGSDWSVIDDGLSRNGTFVNEWRVQGRRRLVDRDMLRLGETRILFRSPSSPWKETAPEVDEHEGAELSEAQRRVLVALCRPFAGPVGIGLPASNPEIAEELSLSVETVRTHLKTLFDKLDVPSLPQHQKRAELARRALASGLVAQRDFRV